MTSVDEIVAAITTEKIIIHRGQVFFNTRDHSEALTWERRGARIVPWYTLEELEAHQAKRGRKPPMGWEVHLLGAVEKVWEENADGDMVDMTSDLLLAAVREAQA